MPNTINPFNYNIDSFDSGFLGPITDTNFRNWIFSHNLPVVNPVIGGVISNAYGDRGTEYDVSLSNPNIPDVPDLSDVAFTPSVYNNLTNPRAVNLTKNLTSVNPEVAALGITNSDLGVDAANLINQTSQVLDLPNLTDASTIASNINNFTQPLDLNLDKNPTLLELETWYPDYNFTQLQANSYRQTYGVPSVLKLGYAGNVEEWVNDGGYITTLHQRRDLELLQPKVNKEGEVVNNKYGPSQIIAYNDALTPPVNTGYIEYGTESFGDFRDQLLSRTLGVGIIPFSQLGSGINYKPDGKNISDLDTIARKRRGVELANRIKLNFIDDTVGLLNTNVFSILAGSPLINRDYTITKPKNGLGKAAEFLASLTGFNLPVSILQPGDFSQNNIFSTASYNKEVDISSGILDRTGKATRNLIIDTVSINKYGPTMDGKYKDLNGGNYLSSTPVPADTKQGTKKGGSIPTNNGTNLGVSGTIPGGFYGKNEAIPGGDASKKAVSESDYGFDSIDNNENIIDANTFDWEVRSKETTTIIGYEQEFPDLMMYDGMVGQGTPITNITSELVNPFKRKGLLKYTQDIINTSNADLTKPGGYIGYFDSKQSGVQTKDAHITGTKGSGTPTAPSKGNMVRNVKVTKNGDKIQINSESGDLYCRSWTQRKQYDTYGDLVRSDRNWWRTKAEDDESLTMNWDGQNTGLPKIAYTIDDAKKVADKLGKIKENSEKTKGVLIPYMFSIENLAWIDAPQFMELPQSEKGVNGGRIMWFPPYDLNVTESTSVSWDSTNFIGRGEPVYTYNHTERSGTLDFTIIVDHPAVLNQMKKDFVNKLDGKNNDPVYQSFFAGCDGDEIKKAFEFLVPSVTPSPKETTDPNTTIPQPVTPTEPPKSSKPNDIKVYYENCRNSKSPYQSPDGVGRAIDFTYETTKACIAGSEYAGTNICSVDSGLNKGVEDKLKAMASFLLTAEGKNYKINIVGYTSAANPTAKFNTQLAQDRAKNLQKYLYDLLINSGDTPVKFECGDGCNKTYPTEKSLKNDTQRWDIQFKPKDASIGSDCSGLTLVNGHCPDGDPCAQTPLLSGQANSRPAKEDRYASVSLEYNPVLQTKILTEIKNETKTNTVEKQKEDTKLTQAEKDKIANFYVNEYEYFETVKKNDKFTYDTFNDKIKNFHPAFHSISPEGFNSRLTFLQQCTRQGPQMIDSTQPANMVFGRPPVCVLKIGDFYHTKIIVDSVNFTYDPLIWDLNPEGIGVQPMLVKVSMGFKFIGGSSLGGPIKQLQNAVSFNFFANTGLYNPARAVEDLLNERKKFIYGAFKSPADADTLTKEVFEFNQNIDKTKAAKIKADKEAEAKTIAEETKAKATAAEQTKIDEAAKTVTPPPAATQGSTKPVTPPPVTSKDGVMTYNQDGTVNITNIEDFINTSFNNKPNVTISNKTLNPLIVSKTNGISTNGGVKTNNPITIQPNGVLQFTLNPDLDEGVTFNGTLTVASQYIPYAVTEKQLKVTLKSK